MIYESFEFISNLAICSNIAHHILNFPEFKINFAVVNNRKVILNGHNASLNIQVKRLKMNGFHQKMELTNQSANKRWHHKGDEPNNLKRHLCDK